MRMSRKTRNTKASMTAEFGVVLALLSMIALLGVNIIMSGMSALYVYLVTYDTSNKVAKATGRAEATRLVDDAGKRLKNEPLSKFFHAGTDFEGGGVSVSYRQVKPPTSTLSTKMQDYDEIGLIFSLVRTKARIEPPLNLSGLAFAAKIPFVTTEARLTYNVESVSEHPECFK